jgi:drug/metabolite transporter (DMT)-like permease
MNKSDRENSKKELKTGKENLRAAAISFLLLVISVVCYSLGLNSMQSEGSDAMATAWLVLFYIFLVSAGITALATLMNSLHTARASDGNRSYAAMFISGLVLMAVIYEILQRI